jgi:hypothetical protein
MVFRIQGCATSNSTISPGCAMQLSILLIRAGNPSYIVNQLLKNRGISNDAQPGFLKDPRLFI